jgi:predicted lipoprotein with Yx(FWY)xxD motif
MRRTLATLALIGGGLLIAAPGCGDDDGGEPAATPEAPAETTAAEPAQPSKSKPGTTIGLIDSRWGKILAGPKSRAIYLFTKEKGTKPGCYGQCAVEWPPVLTNGRPGAGSGVDAAELGTTKRSDGKLQVTYNGEPLYYWYKDPPGQVLCQAVNEFGGFWYIVDPDGDAITQS